VLLMDFSLSLGMVERMKRLVSSGSKMNCEWVVGKNLGEIERAKVGSKIKGRCRELTYEIRGVGVE